MHAARLAAIVPHRIHVRAADGMLWYSCGGRFPSELNGYRPGQSGTYVRDNFEAYAEDLSDAFDPHSHRSAVPYTAPTPHGSTICGSRQRSPNGAGRERRRVPYSARTTMAAGQLILAFVSRS